MLVEMTFVSFLSYSTCSLNCLFSGQALTSESHIVAVLMSLISLVHSVNRKITPLSPTITVSWYSSPQNLISHQMPIPQV